MRQKLCILIVLGILCAAFPHGSSAGKDADASREALLKAAFLYNFAKFVDWPAEAFTSPEAPVILCILG